MNDKQYYQDITGYGNYQYTDFMDVVNGFIISYVGEDKIIPKLKRTDAVYHAKRGLQELSYDTFKSIKAQEIELPANLTMILPKDYVNYVKIASVDSAGIEHRLYPTKDTSNPFKIKQRSNGEYDFDRNDDGNDDTDLLLKPHTVNVVAVANSVAEVLQDAPVQEYIGKHVVLSSFTTGSFSDLKVGMEMLSTLQNKIPSGVYIKSIDSTNSRVFLSEPIVINFLEKEVTFITKESNSWKNYKSSKPSEDNNNNFDYDDNMYDHILGQRYGLDPQHAQINGSFYIDEQAGRIHFSSGLSSSNIVLKYISDSLGTEEEMKVHKFAEEALYKYIAHAVIATRANVPEYIVNRFKREAYAAKRQAKLRLSNFKVEEFAQILRGKSKQIKH
tara:strand:- start:78 stop:1238 length:1161 start_codon:yes stop_codon:yes gene_type:complete